MGSIHQTRKAHCVEGEGGERGTKKDGVYAEVEIRIVQLLMLLQVNFTGALVQLLFLHLVCVWFVTLARK